MEIEIEIEIEIASFRQDCRKYQDCFFSGNLFQELIGTVFGGNLHHWCTEYRCLYIYLFAAHYSADGPTNVSAEPRQCSAILYCFSVGAYGVFIRILRIRIYIVLFSSTVDGVDVDGRIVVLLVI